MQEIKILGTGCANCKTLHSLVEQVVGEMQLNVVVTKEEDLTEILKFDVLSLPATAQAPATKRHIDVLYFHGKQRCATCIAVGTLARAVVEQQFATQYQQGIVRFREIDFSTPDGTKTAEKYEMIFSG